VAAITWLNTYREGDGCGQSHSVAVRAIRLLTSVCRKQQTPSLNKHAWLPIKDKPVSRGDQKIRKGKPKTGILWGRGEGVMRGGEKLRYEECMVF
jgi:hypothetical protein